MSTNGVEYILRCDKFGEEQWARLIELRVERMRRHLKDIAAAKLESIPLLRSGMGEAWASLRDRKDPSSTHHVLDLRGIFYVVRDQLRECPIRWSHNVAENHKVPADHILVFGPTHAHREEAGWAFVDIQTSERDGKEYPLNLKLVRLPPREIAKETGVTLTWIFRGLLAEASRWESARDRLLQEARQLTNDLAYEHHVVWDAWRAKQERASALAEPADPTS